VRTNQAHLDPRTKTVPGTPPDEAEALITVPLIARDLVKGVLNIYRLGEEASFSDEEFELTTRFADAAALALDNAQIRARLEYQAQTDSLTGLYNHRYFHERLRAELTRANRTRESVAVLMLDIDDFKRVNDVYGHGSGDQVLTDLAELLRATFPGGSVTGAPKLAAIDHVARLEPVGRGASMGAIGRVHPNGDLDLGLTIRTFAIADGEIHLWVGGGIVWDSDAAEEVEESLVKARPLLRRLSAGAGDPSDGGMRIAARA